MTAALAAATPVERPAPRRPALALVDDRRCDECGGPYTNGRSNRGYCLPCYKRLVWRPRGGPAVRRSDEASRRAKGHYWPVGAQPRAAAKCGPCGRFKSRPSSVCGYCGDDPVTYQGDPYQYDLAHGWDAV